MENERVRGAIYGLGGAAASLTSLLAASGCGGGACAACLGCVPAGGVAGGLLVIASVVRELKHRPRGLWPTEAKRQNRAQT